MSDVMGVSGRAMIEALLHGTTNPTVLADLARGRLRSKLPALQQALRGQFRRQHAFLVTQILAKIDRHVRFFEAAMTIPGLARRNAITVLADGRRYAAISQCRAFVQLGGDLSGST